jgi:hypothetical protein
VISWIDLFTRKKACSRKQEIVTLVHRSTLPVRTD